MRGYLSFLLVFAALTILVVLANSYINSKSMNFSKAIALERMEQTSLDVKRSMLTSAKYGAIAGFLEYVGEIIGSGGLKAFDPKEAEERVKAGVLASFGLLIFSENSDYEILPWCGEIASESNLDAIAVQTLKQGTPQLCPSCLPLSQCKDFIDVNILANFEQDDFAIADVRLGSHRYGEIPRIFGLTIYSAKFNISKVSYIPTTEKVFEVPYSIPAEMIK